MKWTLDHSGLPAYLHVTVEGKATAEDALALLDELVSSENWHPGMSVVVDKTNLLPLGNDGSRIVQHLVRGFIEHHEKIGKSCIATVHPKNETYNYVRQFEYGIRLRGSAAVVRSFADFDRAVEWVRNHAGMYGVYTEAK